MVEQIVGVGATNGSTRPVEAVAGEIVQRSSIDVAGAKEVEGVNFNRRKAIRTKFHISNTKEVYAVGGGSTRSIFTTSAGDVVGFEEFVKIGRDIYIIK